MPLPPGSPSVQLETGVGMDAGPQPDLGVDDAQTLSPVSRNVISPPRPALEEPTSSPPEPPAPPIPMRSLEEVPPPRQLEVENISVASPFRAREPVHVSKGGFTPQRTVAFLEMFKLLGFFVSLLKVVIITSTPAGDDGYHEWAILTLLAVSYIMLLRIFDQVSLLLVSANWTSKQCMLMGVAVLPITLICRPLNWLTFRFYTLEPKLMDPEEIAVFARRPLSTLLLGLPIAGIMSTSTAGRELILNPMQVHVRAMQSLYQCVLSDIPAIVVDMVIIVNAGDDERKDVTMFWLSFWYSVVNLFLLCYMTVKEVDASERKRSAYEAASMTSPPTSPAGAAPERVPGRL